MEFAPSEEVTDLKNARLEGDDSYHEVGLVEFQYWQRYGEYLDQADEEMPPNAKWKDVYRQKGMEYQFDWPVLNIEQGGTVGGPFLNRVTKRQLRSRARKAILQEMFTMSYIGSTRDEYGPFETHEGIRISSCE